MRNINKLVLALALSMAVIPAYAGNDNGPTFFGDTTNNNQTYNQPTASATGGAGGSATAIGNGGTAFGGNVGDIRNTNTANGGSVLGSGNSTNNNVNTALGGQGGIGLGGSAFQGQGQQQGQGQDQSQGQHQSNVGLNSQGQSLQNSVGQSTDASSKNDNKSTASGNATQVAITEVHPDDVTIRQAPAMVAVAPQPTVSCYKTYGGTLSGIIGGAGFSGGKIDQGCELREMVRITAGLDDEGARKLLCLNEVYSYANPSKCAGVRPVFLLDGKAGKQLRANKAADAKK